MISKAASPIVLSMVVVWGASCAARKGAAPEAPSSAAAPPSAPHAVPSPSAVSERPVSGNRRDEPPPIPIQASSTATPPVVAKDATPPSAPVYVFTPEQVATARPSAAPPGSAAGDPPTFAQHDAAPPRELRLAVVASSKAIAAGGIISVDVTASSRSAVVDAPLHLLFDPSVLEFVDGAPGDFLTQGGSSIVFLADGTSVPGDVAVAAGRVEREHGASGDGLLCRVRFRGIGAGTTAVAVGEAKVWGTGGEALTVLAGRTDVVVY